jgi:DNA-binding NtrC family response regulator
MGLRMATSVLVVDGNRTDRKRISAVLSRNGFAVASTADGRNALQFIDSTRTDLVLLDMVMSSGFDGWFFLGQRRHRAAAMIPVLMVSDLPIANEPWAVELGATGFLKKPFDAETLLEAVRRLTG